MQEQGQNEGHLDNFELEDIGVVEEGMVVAVHMVVEEGDMVIVGYMVVVVEDMIVVVVHMVVEEGDMVIVGHMVVVVEDMIVVVAHMVVVVEDKIVVVAHKVVEEDMAVVDYMKVVDHICLGYLSYIQNSF